MATLTIEQIAELADVSRSTVSRVLNNHPSVRPAVRDRILQVINENGYAPQAAARSLASRRTNVIGLVIPRSAAVIFSDPFFPHVIQGINEACTNRGYFLMLSMVTADLEPGFYNRIVRSRHFDGVIMLSSDLDDPILPLLMKDRTPLVLVGRHPYFTDLTWVDVENREGAREAVKHLINLGHQRIGMIAGQLQMAAALDRRDGYKQALLEAALPIIPELMVEGGFTQQGGYQAMTRLINLPQRPTAVFVASDTMSIGALRAIHEADLSVPRDIALVSFDDLPVASFATPPLTTMRQPIFEMGCAAAELLIARLESQDITRIQRRIPTTLIVRQSCGAAPMQRADEKGT
jgi:DNA-binding LacI/PurR family transcriptional regulator